MQELTRLQVEHAADGGQLAEPVPVEVGHHGLEEGRRRWRGQLAPEPHAVPAVGVDAAVGRHDLGAPVAVEVAERDGVRPYAGEPAAGPHHLCALDVEQRQQLPARDEQQLVVAVAVQIPDVDGVGLGQHLQVDDVAGVGVDPRGEVVADGLVDAVAVEVPDEQRTATAGVPRLLVEPVDLRAGGTVEDGVAFVGGDEHLVHAVPVDVDEVGCRRTRPRPRPDPAAGVPQLVAVELLHEVLVEAVLIDIRGRDDPLADRARQVRPRPGVEDTPGRRDLEARRAVQLQCRHRELADDVGVRPGERQIPDQQRPAVAVHEVVDAVLVEVRDEDEDVPTLGEVCDDGPGRRVDGEGPAAVVAEQLRPPIAVDVEHRDRCHLRTRHRPHRHVGDEPHLDQLVEAEGEDAVCTWQAAGGAREAVEAVALHHLGADSGARRRGECGGQEECQHRAVLPESVARMPRHAG